jgi:DNA-directed RNA polymerase subunit RPC12/RpoP
VDNNLPSVLDIYSSESVVIRGGLIFYFANASDEEDQESELRCEFESRISGGSWDNASFSERTYDIDFWQVGFSPGSGLSLGEYEIRVGFYDKDGGFSDWLALNVFLLNSPPGASNLGVTSNKIRRGESVIIFAEGGDYEDPTSELSISFQYRPSDSPSEPWITLLGESYSGTENRFEISFKPTSSFITGDYDIRVKTEDSDGDESPWIELKKALEVLNSPPSVVDISLSNSEKFREEELKIFANAQDVEDEEGDLEARFEYSLGGTLWKTEYLGIPSYQSGQWQISFVPLSEADLGSYSFRVRFSDGEDESAWAYSNGSFLVKNNPPSVDIINSGLQDDKTVSFSATVSDPEDSKSSLSYLWDFGDGETSTSDGPVHTFDKSGTYTISLTVTDSDGSEITDTSEIIIEGEAGIADQDETGDMVTLVILLGVVAIIVVLVLVLLLRKKKPEETWLPETTHGVVQPVTAPPPPTYETPSPPPPKAQPPAPQQTVPLIPAAQGAEKQAQFKKSIKCPKCNQTFKIPFKKGMQRITCPHCGISGNIKL